MSVETTFDRMLADAKSKLDGTIDAYIGLFKDGTWGKDEYTEDFLSQIDEDLLALKRIRRRLP